MPIVLNKKANPMIKNNPKIPAGWSVKRLDEIGIFMSGTGFPEKEQGGIEGLPFYKVSDMNLSENSIYMIKSNNYVTESQIKQMHIRPILQKSILFAKVGAAIFLERKRIAENFLCDNNMMCFSPFGFSLFYKYYFDILRLSKYAQVGALPSYNASDLANIKILLPPLAEQEKIAEILGAWDSAIEKLTALIAAKRLQKKGMMQKLLTARIRLPGFTGEWQKVKLGDFLKFQTGFPFDSQFFNQDSAGIRLVKNRDLKSDDQVYFYSGKYADTDIVENGDILVGMDGDFLPCLWKKGTALLNQRVGKIVCKKTLNHTFAYYILFSPLEKIQNETASTTVKHLSHSGVEKIKTTIPIDISEQKAIADILSKADEEIDLLTRKLDLIQSQKKGLMQQLLTGKIRVKVV